MASTPEQNLNLRTSTSRYADVAHQTLTFDREIESERLVLELIDSKWVQRLRHIRQTGNTNLVYMFAEHSRFGHSLGVAYLASLLMKNLSKKQSGIVDPWKNAISAAALLHDIGHTAPGSHLAERVWSKNESSKHEKISTKIISQDPEINKILNNYSPDLSNQIVKILSESPDLPPWTHEIISGGGWNADRGNWAIVDSAMCSVSYGRYNVLALLDSFQISTSGNLILQENRLDALTHFYVARDSMYRQVYQHRVLQAADALIEKVIKRVQHLVENNRCTELFLDQTMTAVIEANHSLINAELSVIYKMTDYWWLYHLEHWCNSSDLVLSDLALRVQRRKLFKTIRLPDQDSQQKLLLINSAKQALVELGLDPEYYLLEIGVSDRHRNYNESPPLVMLDSGEIIAASKIEPLIAKLIEPPERSRSWLALPAEAKLKLGRIR